MARVYPLAYLIPPSPELSLQYNPQCGNTQNGGSESDSCRTSPSSKSNGLWNHPSCQKPFESLPPFQTHPSSHKDASYLKWVQSPDPKSSPEFTPPAEHVVPKKPLYSTDCPPSSKLGSSSGLCELSLPDGDRRKNMIPKVMLRDIGTLISKVCPKLSIAPTFLELNNGTVLSDGANHKQDELKLPALVLESDLHSYSEDANDGKRETSYRSGSAEPVPIHQTSPSVSNLTQTFPVKSMPYTAKLKYMNHSLSDVDFKSGHRHRRVRLSRHGMIKGRGFPGFSEEDSTILKKTRFHVNTNILATSLDLLDLHKNAHLRSGSPLECSSCGIIFSTVRHCKYHQSVISSHIPADPSRHHTVKGDGVWLCPWCPVVCLTIDYLSKHKTLCRERGRCQYVGKVSSQRKGTSNTSRRRNSLPQVGSTKSDLLTRSNSFKVVHGHVIAV